MSENKEYPKCHFCHREMAEGSKYKCHEESEPMYVCFDCFDLITTIVGDALPQLLRDVADHAEEPSSEKLESWRYEEAKAK